MLTAIFVLVILQLAVTGIFALKSFGGEYWRTKGKNVATKEDIGEITAIVKRIESEISGELWNKQKQWELKRDVLLEAIKSIAATDEQLFRYGVFVENVQTTPNPNPTFQAQEGLKAQLAWRDAQTRLDDARETTAVVCSEELKKVFDGFANAAYDSAAKLAQNDLAGYKPGAEELFRYLIVLRKAIRKELGIA